MTNEIQICSQKIEMYITSSKIAYLVKDENINGVDYENIQKLFKWGKAKGGIYDIFQIKYLNLNNR
jgi:hypothetical protein